MPPLSDETSLGFTSSLLTTLMMSRAKLDAYVEAEMQHADASAAAYEARVAIEQQSVDTHVANLLAVQFERGLSIKEGASVDGGFVHQRQALHDQQDTLKHEIERLQQELTKQENHVQELKEVELKQRARAAEVRELKKKIEENKQTTVDDLTRGIVNYKYLGLDFEKAEGNRLRFTFTRLDAGEPHRMFSFVLNVNDDDVYEVENCQPMINDAIVMELVNNLNDTDDLSPFVRGMRIAFSDTL